MQNEVGERKRWRGSDETTPMMNCARRLAGFSLSFPGRVKPFIRRPRGRAEETQAAVSQGEDGQLISSTRPFPQPSPIITTRYIPQNYLHTQATRTHQYENT